MATFRPFFKLRVADLESIFDASQGDQAILENLADELGHRSTDRSTALLKRVQKARAEAKSPQEPIHVPQEAPPIPATNATARVPVRPTRVSSAINQPVEILSAWTALEALSPQTFRRPADLVNGDQRAVAQFDGNNLPWFRGERSRPKYKLYYQVILGCVPMERATAELVKIFGADEEQGRQERGKAALAAIMLDSKGMLLQDNAVAISSFGWALPVALSGDLVGLGAWPSVEQRLLEDLQKHFARVDPEGNAVPIDASTLQTAFQWLVNALGLPTGLYEEPSFALRVYQHYKSKSPPEVALLNSFFLADLAFASKLIEDTKPGAALARYLGAEKVTHSANLLKTHSLLEAIVAPGNTPATRWPAPGGHPLVTLQQAAVNAARIELASAGTGLVAVNGPPGTGKTTLLRDIVASCVLDRASAMAAFDDPLQAFNTTGQKVTAGDSAFFHLYRLDESLKGHEVVVASSNNKAVENVSRELPALKAMGRNLTYFKTVSDRLSAKRSEDGSLIEGDPSWGLIAVVLGNASNRNAFQQALWYDNDRSLRVYLKAAKGDAVFRELKDAAGKLIGREVPAVVEAESPPSPEEAKVNWRKARSHFKSLRAELERELSTLEQVRQACLKIIPMRDALRLAQHEHDLAGADRSDRLRTLREMQLAREVVDVECNTAKARVDHALATRPGWLHRLFNTAPAKKWRGRYRDLAASFADVKRRVLAAVAAHETAERSHKQAETRWGSTQEKFIAVRAELQALEKFLTPHRIRLGSRLVDDVFFTQSHECWNMASPWLPDDLQGKREDLFAASLELHRAFIDATAQKIAHNLGALMGAMHAGAFRDEAKRALLGDLWSTLFLVCPVVSTTFASVNRMLGDMPPFSLGWLLVDEAGQATPQSAIGMIMRVKKVIVVGDPLQIPPVVTMPPKLLCEIAKYFNIDADTWLAPQASVQTLADQASRLKAEFRADVGVREVGIPLLVHRRCQEPMFGISNRIAYDDQMVFAAGEMEPGPVYQALGASGWFNVDAPAESKWCPAEGDAVISLLEKLVVAGVRQPDVYIITPFRLVAQGLRNCIGNRPDLLRALDVDSADWLGERVGTIHTFQGKEAAAVIAVLGAPMATQQGARRWATSAPNIFNVMVSRAKQGLYVVGSRAAWSTTGNGRALAAALALREL